MSKRVPPYVRMQGSIVNIVDPSKCQTSIRKLKAFDVQRLINAPPLQLCASNDMDSSTTVSRCCITLSSEANLEIYVLGIELFVFPLYHLESPSS